MSSEKVDSAELMEEFNQLFEKADDAHKAHALQEAIKALKEHAKGHK